MSDISLFCIFHKECNSLDNNNYTQPLQVGTNNTNVDCIKTKDYYPDFSKINVWWNEMEAEYFIWKNIDAKIKGQFQYSGHVELLPDQIQSILEKNKVICSSINLGMSIKKHYYLSHDIDDYNLCFDILKEFHPEQKDNIEIFNNTQELYYRHILIATKEEYNNYCNWVFPIMFEFQKRRSFYTVEQIQEYYRNVRKFYDWKYQMRSAGFLGERLFTFYCKYVLDNNVLITNLKMFSKV